MAGSQVLQKSIILVLIFSMILFLIFATFQDMRVRSLFIVLAVIALVRVVYQVIRPKEDEVLEGEGPEKVVPVPGTGPVEDDDGHRSEKGRSEVRGHRGHKEIEIRVQEVVEDDR
jgi:hypothetical protein